MANITARAINTMLAGMLLAGSSLAQQPAPKSEPAAPAKSQQPAAPKSAETSPLVTKKDKVSYALGMNVGDTLRRQAIEVDLSIFERGIKDALAGKTLLSEEQAVVVLMQLQAEMRAQQEEKLRPVAEANRKEGETFLAETKTREGVVTLPSGLQYKILTAGTGPKPTLSDTVVCNYRGTFINGKEFDSSAKNGGPQTFPVNRVIRGWTEALQLMPVGSKWQLFVPSDLAYGPPGREEIPPNATLIFEVELLSIQGK